MKKINTKRIMNMAWRMARSAARRFQGKAKEFFAESLRICWNIYLAPLGKAKSMFTNTPKSSSVAHRKPIGGIGKSTSSKPIATPRKHSSPYRASHVDPIFRSVETRYAW